MQHTMLRGGSALPRLLAAALSAGRRLAVPAAPPSSAESWRPEVEEVRQFFEEAVSAGVVRGPKWRAVLGVRELHAAAQAVNFPGLPLSECRRVLEHMDINSDGQVTWGEFLGAVQGGSLSDVLRSLVHVYLSEKRQGFSVPADYDYDKSTAANYNLETPDVFVGDFVRERQALDYSYHMNYVHERQLWQDRALRSVAVRSPPQEGPWLVYTCGPMGVGKGYVLSWMARHGFFPLESYVHIDPDHFKSMMPEWPRYVATNSEEAGRRCHIESGFIGEIVQEVAMRRRQNIWIEGSLRNTDWHAAQIKAIRAKHPSYRICIFYVFADEATIHRRMLERYEKTGRFIPERTWRRSIESMDRSLNMLTPLCDFVARIDNSGPTPVLTAFEEVDTSGSWAAIPKALSQTHAQFPQHLSPIAFRELRPELLRAISLAKVNPEATPRLCVYLDQLAGVGCQNELRSVMPDVCRLPASAVRPLKLSRERRTQAGMPTEATGFFFVHAAQETLPEPELFRAGLTIQDLDDPAVKLLRYGGFALMDSASRIVAVYAFTPSGGRVQWRFSAPAAVPEALAAEVPAERWQPVPWQWLRTSPRGQGDTFAWLAPTERLSDGHRHGGHFGAFFFRLRSEDRVLRFQVAGLDISPFAPMAHG